MPSDALYNQELLSYVTRIKPEDRLSNPSTTDSAYSPICGTEITIDINIDENGNITALGYDSDSACALTKTTLAILLGNATGQNISQIEAGLNQLNDVLEGTGTPKPPWENLSVLGPAKDYTARHNSMRLPFEATLKALQKLAK